MQHQKLSLGLDIGSNSIGFALLRINEKDDEIIFDEIERNSIVFSEPSQAVDRRNGRGQRRKNERKSSRNKIARKIFVDFEIADKMFIDNTTNYLNSFTLNTRDVYLVREKAISGISLTKEEFILATYSILTDRGYNNMFATDSSDEEDGKINEAISINKQAYEQSKYILPSSVLVAKRNDMQLKYQNFPIRNKGMDYRNSLSRAMHKDEFIKVATSQASNEAIFLSPDECSKFIDNIINEDEPNRPFYQRPLKSFEDMVGYCTFYDKFNPKGSFKRIPLANIKNIESTLRQSIDNYQIIETKTGVVAQLSKEEINQIIDFWIDTPSSDEINFKNIFKSAGFKNIELFAGKNASDIVLNIKSHRALCTILEKYSIDFKDKDNQLYNELLLILFYFKNKSVRVEKINILIENYGSHINKDFAEEVSSLHGMDGFGRFSMEFIREVLNLMSEKNIGHHDALDDLGYFCKYTSMPSYKYLPPLEPTKADIKWLQENISYFDTKHLFYQPMISQKVKRVISILRKLVNELIGRHGYIDEIRIETARELNSDLEESQITENQKKDKKKNDDAIKYLKDNRINDSSKNIERAKLFIEQGKKCPYSDETVTSDEAFDENETEVEHFIPRSVIWINSYKNKLLVKKKYNQNKGSQNPITYLSSIGQWDNFRGRISEYKIAINKQDWLTNEEIIENVMKNEHWQDSYLNDTRTATRVVAKYLNHYLYPNQTKHAEGEERHIFSVSGKAISELKYMWGIHNIMPKNEDNKKDRNTNYHHTLDAFAVALCSNSAIQTLHSHFKQKENKFKTKAQKENLKANVPISKDGVGIVEHLKELVNKYETNQLLVCPYSKRKTNAKGFKDGNLKLCIVNDKNGNEILSELDNVYIDISLLIKDVGGFPKPRSDGEVLEAVKTIQSRLDAQKQNKIIDAIDVYAKKLIELRSEIGQLDAKIKEMGKDKKTGKQHKEANDKLKQEIEPYRLEKEILVKEQSYLKCTFITKNGKLQTVKRLRFTKSKAEETKADAIIFPKRIGNGNTIERLSVYKFKQAVANKEPFVAKMNESTLSVELFDAPKGQVVGLNYFSSVANHIDTKTNNKYKNVDFSDSNSLKLYKNDIIKVSDIKNSSTSYCIFNGGGLVAGSNNKLTIKNININNFKKQGKDGEVKFTKEDTVTPNVTRVIKRVKIDFFGNITED